MTRVDRKGERGAVAVTVALLMTVLVMVSAAAVDFSRAFYVKNALQITIDSAVKAASATAVSQSFALPDADLQVEATRIAKNYIKANAPFGQDVVTYDLDNPSDFTLTYTPANDAAPNTNNENTVAITFNGRIQLSLMRMFMTSLPVTVSSRAQRPRAQPLELVLALDVTQSMSDTLGNGSSKLDQLKAAATSLTDFVMQSSNVKVGLMPFTQQVNIGPAFLGKPWLNAQTATICDVPPCTSQCSAKYWGTCTKGDGTTVGCWQQDCTQTCQNCRTQGFQGCIPARGKTINKVYVPSDTIANPTNPQYWGQSANCTIPLYTDLTSKTDYSGTGATVIRNKIAALKTVSSATQGNTYIPIGLIWAWNMLDSAEPLTLASSVRTGPTAPRKTLVLITDGDNYWTPTGPANGGTAGLSPSSDAVTLSTCANIKADTTNAISIYTVAVAVTSATTLNMLKTCASSPDNFFDVQSTSDLQDAFKKIAVTFTYNTLTQ